MESLENVTILSGNQIGSVTDTILEAEYILYEISAAGFAFKEDRSIYEYKRCPNGDMRLFADNDLLAKSKAATRLQHDDNMRRLLSKLKNDYKGEY